MTVLRRSEVNTKTHRLIASRYPTVGVFDDIAFSAEEVRAAFLIEALTNDRLAVAAGRMGVLPYDEIITAERGAGATLVMAAFLHAADGGGRFTDGRLGGWYASFELQTALRETAHHSTARLQKSAGGFPARIQMRELTCVVDAALVDIRGLQEARPELYHPSDYTQSQAFAAGLRWPRTGTAENGLVFDSIRHVGGTNVCMFWPSKVPLPVVQADHFEYSWDAVGAMSLSRLSHILV